MIRTACLSLLALAAGAFAQGPPSPGPRLGPGPGGVRFLGAQPGMPGKLIKGAPYSADVITESTQTLADGNHIRQTSNSKVYRDSEGRTRQEQSLNGLASIAGNTALPNVVFIHDPVAGQSFALNATDKTATRTLMRRPRMGDAAPPSAASGNEPMMAPRMRGGFGPRANSQNVKSESLGRQTIEGVVADGTRMTLTIPAGQMGNEQPIQIVTERWYSPELQTVVLSKRTDPRNGETVTRLANVSRTEPSRTLFEVPPDYKISENNRMRPGGPSKNQ
jgi:hypothetical protein